MMEFTEDPFYNSSLVYHETVASLNDLTVNVLNTTLENVISSLNNWQKKQLMDIDSELGFECLLRMWFKHPMDDIDTKLTYCNATWDQTCCLPRAPVGTKFIGICSQFGEGEISQVCLENGTWSQPDLCEKSCQAISSIFVPNGHLSVIVGHMVFIGSILSLISLAVSLGIFCCLRTTWSQRLTLQVHFMLVLLFRFVILFVITEPFIFDRKNTYINDDILCKTLVSFYLYSCLASVMWMLVQGIHLNGKLTTNVLCDESLNKIRFYYFLGWFFPAAVMILYLVVMTGNSDQKKCWKGYSNMKEIWIILGPILVALLLNAIFFLNILRVIVCKSRGFSSASESAKLGSIAKATGILFPVLGVNNMLLVYNPGGEYEKYFTLINAFFGSTQGVLVAMVYCLMSKDVQKAVSLAYNRFRTRREFQMRRIPLNESILLRNLPVFSREQTERSLNSLCTSHV